MLLKILAFLILILGIEGHTKRSIDLIATHNLISDTRLPRDVTPNRYKLDIHPFPEEGHFKGRVRINITWQETTDKIILHAHEELVINQSEIKVRLFTKNGDKTMASNVNYQRAEMIVKQPLFAIYLDKAYNRGTQCEVDIFFSGTLKNDTTEGLYRSNYVNSITGQRRWFVVSHFRPNFARKLFPCFDEPSYKVPFKVSIIRFVTMNVLFNTYVQESKELADDNRWIKDTFQETPPISTFALGFLIADFRTVAYNASFNRNHSEAKIEVWGRPDYLEAIQPSFEKIYRSMKALEEFWGMPFPLRKVDCIALPNYQGTRPADNWGLIFFKESELSNKGTWQLTHELVYQWLGTLATPAWWNDAHINNALARYIATSVTLKISDGKETFHNWPMTMLYSIYYEFSKRYPHGKVMAIKQDSGSTKTELVFRMLNYTLGENTLQQGLQRFMADRQFKTFFAEDIWTAITQQSHEDKTLEEGITVNEIASSWITKDRLPVLSVVRNYKKNTAILNQRVYLRERPHDVPDQDKLLWWIPIVLVRQDNLDFDNYKPLLWVKRQREVEVTNMPKENQFIIINPEEIGPFPVNYDTRNWNLLADYLRSEEGRTKIPVNTRAKLLHDAWNLAYAGDLNFATALNMTLFLQNEREYLAWDPVFTMIDHIGRHIDSSSVHKKFLTYVRTLLTPLYEGLGDEPKEGESEGVTNLRSSAKVFLCQAGYKPCIEEAQEAFNKWMKIENPDEGNPVANQYICPVFKWGTKEEWEFGLQRIINFPASRKQNERTYLLKTLAGCPVDSWKIEKILNITIFEQNGNFTDNDIFLIFSMLTGSSSGYTSLFNYLNKNWDAIKKAFENKPQLWNSLITSSTSVFKTQEGLDKVAKLYKEREGQFGTAEFVIEKALKNIKEEAQWSNDNLPVIEDWLNNHLKTIGMNNEKDQKFL